MPAWTDEKKELLRKLWEAGTSLTDCGTQLGCSRSSVSGMVNRLGLSGVSRAQKHITAKPNRRKGAGGLAFKISGHVPFVAPSEPLPPPSKIEVPGARLCSLIELKSRSCRFPHGDHAPYLFCGAPSDEVLSYCGIHMRLTHHGVPQRRVV